ncbi:hypothetical protein VTG60DRAFT_5610 [Thermothelomyces hinnuleus]
MPFQTTRDQRRYAPLSPSPLNPNNTYLNSNRDHQGQQRPQWPNRTSRQPLKVVLYNNSSRIAQRYAALANESPTQRLLRQKAAAAWQLTGALQARRHQAPPEPQRSVHFETGPELHHHYHHHHHQQQQQAISEHSFTCPSTTSMKSTATATTTSNAAASITATTSGAAGGNWTTSAIPALAMPALPADEESDLSVLGAGSENANKNEDEDVDEDVDEADIGLLLVVKNQRTGAGAGAGAERGSTSSFERYRDVSTAGDGGCGDKFSLPAGRGGSGGVGGVGGVGGSDSSGGGGGSSSGDSGTCPFRLAASPRVLSLGFERPLLPLHTAVKQRAGRRRFGEGDGYGTGAGRDGRVSRLRRVMLMVAVLLGLALVRGLTTGFRTSRTE